MRDYLTATERELDEWPGVSFRHGFAGKHGVITVVFCGRPRKLFVPVSPSDSYRGVKNYISDLRSCLTALGAKRNERPKRTNPQRQRNKPVRPLVINQPAPIMPDPFEVLAQWKDKAMTREVTINGKTVTLESGVQFKPRSITRPKTDLRLLLEQMRDGESAFLPVSSKTVQAANLYTMGKQIGAKFCYQTEPDGVRIFRNPAKADAAPVTQEPATLTAVGWR